MEVLCEDHIPLASLAVEQGIYETIGNHGGKYSLGIILPKPIVITNTNASVVMQAMCGERGEVALTRVRASDATNYENHPKTAPSSGLTRVLRSQSHFLVTFQLPIKFVV